LFILANPSANFYRGKIGVSSVHLI
jgi:hypothetical protein